MSRPRLIACSLALVTLALYLPVAWFSFCVYDDGLFVPDNPMVQKGVTLAGLKWAFTSMSSDNWHPVTWISHMIDCGVFGLNPGGPHLVNALLHAVNAALLFILLFRLTEKLWPAAFVAALFAWHPMHVESVAWIAERRDVLSTFFALLALLGYARYVRENCRRSYVWSLACFALGLMSKPMLVTLPCVLLLLDFWPLGRISLERFKLKACLPLLVEKIPFFLLTAADCLVTVISQSQHGRAAIVTLDTVPVAYRLKSVPVAYVEYVCKTFWPAKLAIFYPLPERIHLAQVVAAVTALAACTLFALWLHRTRPYLAVGWLWFVGMLVPVIGLVQVGAAQMADRYSYLPSIGLFIAVTFAALDLAARWRISGKVLGTLAVAIALACMVAMENQLQHWQTNIRLFQHALAVTADNDVARNNLGVAFEQAGRDTEALEQFRAAAALETTAHWQGHHNYASALDRHHRPAEALVEHRAALRLGPEVPMLHNSLGVALAAGGQTDEAFKEFAEATRLDPNYPWPHIETAKVYLKQGRDAEAIEELRAAVRAAPDNPDVLTYVAQVLASSDNAAIRDGNTAFVLAAKANLLSGGNRPFTLDVLGMACAEMGKFEEAKLAAQQALDIAAAMKLKKVEPIQQRLELYQQGKPWRESFRATNAPAQN